MVAVLHTRADGMLTEIQPFAYKLSAALKQTCIAKHRKMELAQKRTCSQLKQLHKPPFSMAGRPSNLPADLEPCSPAALPLALPTWSPVALEPCCRPSAMSGNALAAVRRTQELRRKP